MFLKNLNSETKKKETKNTALFNHFSFKIDITRIQFLSRNFK